MADRFSRKEIKHDKFVEEMETAYAVARRNAPAVVWSIVAVLVLIAAVAAFMLWRTRQENVAQKRLAEGIQVIEAPMAAPGETAPAPGTYGSEQEKIAKAEPIFRDVVDKYGSSDAADVASLYLAKIEVARGDTKSAREKLEAFVDEHEGHLLAMAARVSLIDLRLAEGEAQQVIADLEKEVASTEGALPQDVALTLLARAYEAAKQPQKARDAYQRIVNEYPDSVHLAILGLKRSPYSYDPRDGSISLVLRDPQVGRKYSA
ncbi:MAG: tetratricopeptide repeat protein, partial [Acidobacteria bacterium]|nr:tetratricopeptide repeat protein [Acidobacteriota bacterium]